MAFEEQKGIQEKVFALKAKEGKSSPILFFETELERYFKGELKIFETPYHLEGSLFRLQVWQVLKGIAFGTTQTYQDVAIEIEKAKAIRAVGSAIGHNPLSLILPCHRVVGKQGLGGYAGGLDRKKWLLEHEMSKKRKK